MSGLAAARTFLSLPEDLDFHSVKCNMPLYTLQRPKKLSQDHIFIALMSYNYTFLTISCLQIQVIVKSHGKIFDSLFLGSGTSVLELFQPE